jgi:hypothetical protein
MKQELKLLGKLLTNEGEEDPCHLGSAETYVGLFEPADVPMNCFRSDFSDGKSGSVPRIVEGAVARSFGVLTLHL